MPGNWIIDQVKIIDVYPKHEQLANIFDQSQGTGGSPYNVLLDLAKMRQAFLYSAGLVGRDALGEYIIEDCRKHNIDPKFISVSPGTSTSYTDVMTEREGGQRTFFIIVEPMPLGMVPEIDFDTSSAKIFISGLSSSAWMRLIRSEPEHGTVGAALLAKARAAGMKTSIDVVSEDSDRFSKIIGPALKQVDYCILNEVEGSKVTGVKVREDGKLLNDGIEETASKLFDLGVGDLVRDSFS